MSAEHNELSPQPSFRELPAVPFWSTNISTSEQDKNPIIQALRDSVEVTQFTYSGFFNTSPEGKVTYHFSRYPRHLYGIASDEECDHALNELTKSLQAMGIEHSSKIASGEANDNGGKGFRVVLGLKEGYGDDAKVYDVSELKKQLPEDVTLTPADIYSVGKWGHYEEPAVVIEGNITQLPTVYQLADKYNQSRFTVENMKKGIAYVVETRHCTDPDPMPSIDNIR